MVLVSVQVHGTRLEAHFPLSEDLGAVAGRFGHDPALRSIDVKMPSGDFVALRLQTPLKQLAQLRSPGAPGAPGGDSVMLAGNGSVDQPFVVRIEPVELTGGLVCSIP